MLKLIKYIAAFIIILSGGYTCTVTVDKYTAWMNRTAHSTLTLIAAIIVITICISILDAYYIYNMAMDKYKEEEEENKDEDESVCN